MTKRTQRGFSLIELMIAILVLAIGMIGGLALITTAISDNTRNKMDTSATLVSQTVIEQINALPANSYNVTSINITDGSGTARTFAVGTGGAALDSSNNVDWTGSANGYTADFVGNDGNTYEVRWNITQLNQMKRVIVSTRRKGAGTNIRIFAPPVTLKTITGP